LAHAAGVEPWGTWPVRTCGALRTAYRCGFVQSRLGVEVCFVEVTSSRRKHPWQKNKEKVTQKDQEIIKPAGGKKPGDEISEEDLKKAAGGVHGGWDSLANKKY